MKDIWSNLMTGKKTSNMIAILALFVSAGSLFISKCQNDKYFTIDKSPNIVTKLEIESFDQESLKLVSFIFSNDGNLEAKVDKIYFQIVDTTSGKVLADTTLNCFERVLSSNVEPCRVISEIYMRELSNKGGDKYGKSLIARFGYHYKCSSLSIDKFVYTFWVAGNESEGNRWREINESDFPILRQIFR
ncbi:MAG: hypothetical protein NTW14_03125 [bacterium]|nr:hypothetical protein [bacterium]